MWRCKLGVYCADKQYNVWSKGREVQQLSGAAEWAPAGSVGAAGWHGADTAGSTNARRPVHGFRPERGAGPLLHDRGWRRGGILRQRERYIPRRGLLHVGDCTGAAPSYDYWAKLGSGLHHPGFVDGQVKGFPSKIPWPALRPTPASCSVDAAYLFAWDKAVGPCSWPTSYKFKYVLPWQRLATAGVSTGPPVHFVRLCRCFFFFFNKICPSDSRKCFKIEMIFDICLKACKGSLYPGWYM